MWARIIGILVLGVVVLSACPGGAALGPSKRLSGGRTYTRVYTWAPDQAWAASAQDLIVTRDGGQTWTILLTVFRPEQVLDNMGFEGALNGQVWWAGDPGLRVTTDGGQSWTTWSQQIFYPDGQLATTVDRIRLVTPTEAWGIEEYAPGQDPPVRGEALRHTRDAGRNWERMPIPKLGLAALSVMDFGFFSPQVGWVMLGSGHVFRTRDGGQTWERCGQLYKLLRQVLFVDPETGWALESRYPYPPQIYRTTDGGQTWALATLPPLPRDTQLSQVFFLDATTGWVAGWSGTILHTTDGGQTWQLQPSRTPKDLTAIHFSDPSTAGPWAIRTRSSRPRMAARPGPRWTTT